MFTFDDFLQKIKRNIQRESFSSEVADIHPQKVEDIKLMFPGVNLSNSQNIVYVPVKVAHSLPFVNARGRCFTPMTMKNSVTSAIDNLIDEDHALVNNGVGREHDEDKIIGHIKAAVLDPSMEAEFASAIPSKAIPLYGLCALFLRSQRVQKIVEQHISGKQRWQVSYELAHRWSEAELLYRDEFIPIKDAPGEMIEGIGRNGIRPYKNHPVSAVLGGRSGHVDFFGVGFTTHPADAGSDVLSMVSGCSQELANKKIFYSPIILQTSKSMELANKGVDRIITELANIEVIGETHPASPDQHTHKILSDMHIMPVNGHAHEMANQNVSTGKNPRLTGRTTTYTEYRNRDSYGGVVSSSDSSVSHAHTFDITLRKKGEKLSNGGTDVANAPTVNATSSTINNPGPSNTSTSNIQGEVDMKLSDITKKLEGVAIDIANLSSVKNDQQEPAITKIKGELNSLADELRKSNQQESISIEIATAIDAKISSGEIVPKSKVDEQIQAAVALKEKELTDAAKIASTKSTRLQRLKDAGVDVTVGFSENIKDKAGNPLTILAFIDSISCDEAGDQAFEIQFNLLAAVIKKEQEQVVDPVTNKAVETPVAAAANKPKTLLTAGAGVATPAANNQVANSTVKSSDRTLVGRGVFSRR